MWKMWKGGKEGGGEGEGRGVEHSEEVDICRYGIGELTLGLVSNYLPMEGVSPPDE